MLKSPDENKAFVLRNISGHLVSKRVHLKKHDLSLAPTLFSEIDADRERLGRFLPWVEGTQTVEDSRGYLLSALDNWGRGDVFDFGVFENETGKFLGNMGAHSIEYSVPRCEIGYWNTGFAEGKGFISEAVQCLENHLFGLGFMRIEVCCNADNARSARVPLRCGYLLEAVLRDDCVEKGELRTTLLFSKLRKDPPRKMDQPEAIGIGQSLIFSKNVPQACDWIEKWLGLKAEYMHESRYAHFRLSANQLLALHEADDRSPVSTGGGVAYLQVFDIEKSLKQALALGATLFRGPIDAEPGEAMAQIQLPTGEILGMVGKSLSSNT